VAEKETTFPISDIAIDEIKDDKFGFTKRAEKLAKLVASHSSSEYITVGISGTWGSGKSSILNLIKCYLTQEKHYLEIFRQDYPEGAEDKKITKNMPIVVEFDPWFFGSEEKIIEAFFLRLAKSITNNGKVRKTIGKGVWWLAQVAKASESLLPVIKNFGEFTEKIADEILGNNNKDFFEIKKELSKNLKKMKKRIIILIDDMDRLQADEILTMLKIIRLVTDLPKINTIIAFDHEVTADIVKGKVGGNGQTYMQKMINVPTYIPRISGEKIKKYLREIHDINPTNIEYTADKGEFYKSDNWEFGCQKINTPRGAKNILNLFFYGMESIGESVDSTDYWGLCILYYYYPKLFNSIYNKHPPFYYRDNEYLSLMEDTKFKITDNDFDLKNSDPVFRYYLEQFEYISDEEVWNEEKVLINCDKLSIRHSSNRKNYFSLISNVPIKRKVPSYVEEYISQNKLAVERSMMFGTNPALDTRMMELSKQREKDMELLKTSMGIFGQREEILKRLEESEAEEMAKIKKKIDDFAKGGFPD
jgi:predicted KAP-like P-loop ATPase